MAFFLLPSVYSVVLSLFDYNGYGTAEYVGIDNYQALLDFPQFWSALGNTVFYWLVPALPMLGGAFLLAVALQSPLARLRKVFTPLVYLPQIMAPVAAALVLRVIFSTNSGVVNEITGAQTGWLTDPALMKVSVSVLLTWRGLGWFLVIFLAGLARIPAELYEAAAMDGARAWQRLVYITLPQMRPIFLFAVVIHTITSLRLYAEPNLLVTGTQAVDSTPAAAAPLMNVLVSNVSNGAFGLAAALGWMLFLLIGAFSIVQFRLLGERS